MPCFTKKSGSLFEKNCRTLELRSISDCETVVQLLLSVSKQGSVKADDCNLDCQGIKLAYSEIDKKVRAHLTRVGPSWALFINRDC